METIVLASNNAHKIKEFKQIFPETEIVSMSEIGFTQDIEETGSIFYENALIKAQTIANYLKEKNIIASVVADDSGLCVNALGGAPGIFSARYAGGHGNDAANRAKLLKELKNKTDRTAYFVCVVVEVRPDGSVLHAEGRTYGKILQAEEGDRSFGYDCLFHSDELDKSFGMATSDEKNSVSHRGKAIAQLKTLRKNNRN